MLTFGTDPEFFISYKEDGKNFAVPPVAFRKYFGVKPVIEDFKHPVFIVTPSGIKIHQDGVAFEFAVPPVRTGKELYKLINEGLDYLNDFANKYGFEIYCKPVVNFDPIRYFQREDEDFKECVIFGCDRDWDAFNMENYNSNIMDVSTHPYRYGGGHLHISGNPILFDLPVPVIRTLALFVGNYFISKTAYPEQEKLRAFHYGAPGKFRPQTYPDGTHGIEYRTPSNSWLSSEETMNGIFEVAEKGIEAVEDEKKMMKLFELLLPNTIKAIKEADINLAKENLEKIKEM